MNTFINNKRLAGLAGVNFDSEVIQPGPIVYSRTHLVQSQFPKLAKMGSCILITSFSDAKCTTKMASRLPPNVRRWFSNNVATRNARVTAVPIGLRTSSQGEQILRVVMGMGRLKERNLVYMNFWRRLRRTPNPRRGIYEMFMCKKWVTYEGGFDHVPMDHFYKMTASHPYTISPPGAGPDCHRHWEAMLLGTIPIVLRSKATDILEDMPCLRITHWGEITERLLLKQLPKLKARFDTPTMDKCWFEYWRDMILEA